MAVLIVAGPARAAEPSVAKGATSPTPPMTAPTPPSPPPGPAAAPPAAPLPPGDAAAPPATPQEAEMQTHRALGHKLYRLGRYEEAVAAFRRAYEVKADPRLLFDIAECYRELGAVDQALFYYDRYLAGWPDAFDRAEVEEKMAALESMRGGLPAPRAAAARRRHPLMISEPPPGKARQPQHAWQRWWFWTAVGAAVLGGIAAGVALSSGSGSPTQMTELGEKRFF
ncbi:MAG TPA: tetratricopeptide repeat protein [Polyangia bacterium]